MDVKLYYQQDFNKNSYFTNKVRFETVNGRDITKYLHIIPLEIFVKNYDNLSTISPTMMETFDDLATADVAIHLYYQLKFF